MTTVLYADVLFIINFSMDFISLWISAKLLSLKRLAWRFALSAALGAFGATVMTALGFEGIVEWLCALALSVAMTLIAFGFGSAKSLAGRSLTLWGIGSLLGGAVTAICSLGGRIAYESASGATKTPWGYIAAGVILVWAFVRLIRPKLGARTAAIVISFGEKRVETRGLVDTGNLCTDPIGGDGVIFITSPLAARLFGEKNAALLTALRPDELPGEYHSRVRLVPAKGIGKSGICAAVVPDLVTFPPDKTPRRALVCVTDVPAEHFGGNDALLPPSIL